MPPLALDNEQLAVLRTLAQPLLPADRGPFLQAVAARLAEHPELVGSGLLPRCASAREEQRRFWSRGAPAAPSSPEEDQAAD